jgi:hypothetical protein
MSDKPWSDAKINMEMLKTFELALEMRAKKCDEMRKTLKMFTSMNDNSEVIKEMNTIFEKYKTFTQVIMDEYTKVCAIYNPDGTRKDGLKL